MSLKLIQQGAEAKIFLTKSDTLTNPNNKEDKSHQVVIKARTPKSYRVKELDNKIRKQRTKAERKLLEKAGKIINIPAVIKVIGDESNFAGNPPEYSIKMEYINGEKLSTSLNDFPFEKQKKVMQLIGESVSKIHKEDIIHGDLTTSNIILVEEDKKRGDNNLKVFFIDFGLGYISKKVEDKAVDLHLLRQALEAKHFEHWKELFEEFKRSYSKDYSDSKQVFERITAVERRGRYRH